MSTGSSAPTASTAANAGKMKKTGERKRKWVDGFAAGATQLYPEQAPRAHLITRKIAYPIGSITGTNTINFSIRAADKFEWIRFVEVQRKLLNKKLCS